MIAFHYARVAPEPRAKAENGSERQASSWIGGGLLVDVEKLL
ncbi:hypothetical protein [Tetragenococcus koreensis]|uniref:Uncharacterized protein n=1 Tax=Tetragenococcus koreensis TaxID=290335 RepID=A0AAN4UCD5_9ENTE|nr:hypothetical protein [Tetragenococcus koreensis]GEQ49817.1 hypothetical protein TK11N_16690 [Tetragenococcus koreensis]GEQ52246.1 hypothetical protein TK12N_15900 [Tetragenococcus koreensis]GEQ54781.1 hypothetical protein TK2N_16250 [Tetragenococcus koreensis]GEQ57265.1 hypothetical protein TK4N_16080 [Tetragenococcus koreensis]GEQ59813.1 hypothetical protein TK6N_16520 [Tetragenococcus koreensis]